MELDTQNEKFQIAQELIRETNESFFLTGKAGTGKSTFLKHFVNTTFKNFVVVAPTGIAAVNVGGVTIHSFFQFPLRPLLPEDEEIKKFWKGSKKRKIISAMDTLIIDEVSMVRADLIDAIDFSLRKNSNNSNLPFGGKQVVFVGDIFQLEPVTIRKSGEERIISELYESPYFFNARVFNEISFPTIELQKVYRQSDPQFIALLDKVRTNEINRSDIKKLNSRVLTTEQLEKKEFAITLTTRNDLADRVNTQRLKNLDTKPFKYPAEISGEFEESKHPTESELILKEDAQVIFIRNDQNGRWINGTIGKITELNENIIKVKLEDGSIHIVEKKTWENIRYNYNKDKNRIEYEVIGKFKQYPLKLAWAITIHKSQGVTFENVVIDFGNGTFASGQAYVALSRVTSFDGLFLKNKIYPSDIYLDNEIKQFSNDFNNQGKIKKSLNRGKKKYKYQRHINEILKGKSCFSEAVDNLKNGNFQKSYKKLLDGFANVSCDCELKKLIKNNQDEIESSLKPLNVNSITEETDFIRAVFNFFTGKADKALVLIDSHLKNNSDSEIAHYLKGRILIDLEKFEEAFKEFDIALSIKETAKVHYRIGRCKEEILEVYGLDYLLNSVLLNPASPCVNSKFCLYANNREIDLKTNTNKFLTNKFNNSSELMMRIVTNKLLTNKSIKWDGEKIYASAAFEDFLIGLNNDAHLFGVETL